MSTGSETVCSEAYAYASERRMKRALDQTHNENGFHIHAENVVKDMVYNAEEFLKLCSEACPSGLENMEVELPRITRTVDNQLRINIWLRSEGILAHYLQITPDGTIEKEIEITVSRGRYNPPIREPMTDLYLRKCCEVLHNRDFDQLRVLDLIWYRLVPQDLRKIFEESMCGDNYV